MTSQVLAGIGFGLVTAAIIALSCVALSLQFSVTRTLNFAHGEFMTLGAYAGYVAAHYFHGDLIVQLVVGVLVGMGAAWLLNKTLFRPFARLHVSPLLVLVITIAASSIVQAILQVIFSPNPVNYPTKAANAYNVGPFQWTPNQIITMLLAAAVLVTLHLVLRRTKFGKAQRAVADDVSLAQTTGIRSNQIITLTWLIDGAVAGLSGVLLALQVGSFTPVLGFSFLLVVFSAAIVGGIGQIYGAMLGALAIGVVTEVSAVWVAPDYKQTMAFLVLVVVLLFRPQGIIAAVQEKAL